MYGLAHTGVSMFIYGGAALIAGGSGLAIKAVRWYRNR